jgi:hypothetical protein
MAGATELSVLHVFHGHSVCAMLDLEQIGMAFSTVIHLDMHGMEEGDISGILVLKKNVFRASVAFDTVPLPTIRVLFPKQGSMGYRGVFNGLLEILSLHYRFP